MDKVECTRCGTSIYLPLEALGRDVRCNECGVSFLPLEQVLASELSGHNEDLKAYIMFFDDIPAFGYLTADEEFVVVRGSKFCSDPDDDLFRLYQSLRNELINHGVLVEDSDGQFYTLTESFGFDDDDVAASIVLGCNIDSGIGWEPIGGKNGVEDDDLDEEDSEFEEPSEIEEVAMIEDFCVINNYGMFKEDYEIKDLYVGKNKDITENYVLKDAYQYEDTEADDEGKDEDEGEDEDEVGDESEEDEDGEDFEEESDDDYQYNEGTHFLDLSREQIRELIVEVLEMRPNNSVKRDELVTEILRHIGVRTSGGPRLQFTSQVMLEVQWLGRQRVLKRYKVKNNRVRLTEFYRSRLSLTSNSDENISEQPFCSRYELQDSVPDTIDALKAENKRLRKIISMLALEGISDKG